MKEVKTKGTIRSKIKRGDTVVFISGREYNRYERTNRNGQEEVRRVPLQGEVIAVDPRRGKVKVVGAQIMKRHRKAVPQMNIEGGIVESEGWVDISNVAVVDPKTGKPTRVRYEIRDGKKVRVAKSGEVIPEPPRRTNTKKKDNDNE
jgi:large subunit ribosomal protein L24